MSKKSLFATLSSDIPASIVVFLVATPLCLGIALASGAPLFSGIIAGIVGGIVVGVASGSALGVSGPAAGLAVIVFSAIATLGSWESFLLAVVLAGAIQLALGYLRAGIIGYYFPSSVIKGMLTGIGLVIILKQLPNLVGYEFGLDDDLAFEGTGGSENTFAALAHMFESIHLGTCLVAAASLAVLLLWEQAWVKRWRASLWIQGPLVAVALGIGLNEMFILSLPGLAIPEANLVQIPTLAEAGGLIGLLTFPDFSQLTNPAVYTVALTIAVVASLETLLCVEATDRLDPQKRVTPTNRELKAQGLGNMLSGLIGGLPVTQVIVRSSANIQSGARSKLSAVLHGVLLLVAVLSIPTLLNHIPLATLAAILMVVGYKLAKPALFAAMYKLGWSQFLPFTVTIAGILLTDLLVGIGMGMAVAGFQILLNNYRNPFFADGELHRPGELWRLPLAQNVTFLNRAAIIRTLDEIPPGSKVEIDATRTVSIDLDVYEILRDFEQRAELTGIDFSIRGLEGMQRDHDVMRRVQQALRRERRRFEKESASGGHTRAQRVATPSPVREAG